MSEQVKRGRGRPKKVQQEQVKQEQITKEDIDKAISEMLDAKLSEAGIVKSNEPPIISDSDIYKLLSNEVEEDGSEPTLEWQPVFNVLTRIYEASDDEYKNVKFSKNKDCITVTLDAKVYKSLKDEITRMKTALCTTVLKFSGDISNDIMTVNITK